MKLEWLRELFQPPEAYVTVLLIGLVVILILFGAPPEVADSYFVFPGPDAP